MNFIALLPFPVLGIDETGTIHESNEALEGELGLERSLQGRALRDVVEESSFAAVRDVLESSREDSPVVHLCFGGAATARARTFYVVVDDGTRWLVGQPLALDEQREALERAHERAEAQTDEYARMSQELLSANEQLAHRARALIEASEAKARFLATMSHELRTPLNAVLGYAGLLRDGVYGTVSEQQERAVQSIVRRAKDLQLLIDDVLDLAKIVSERSLGFSLGVTDYLVKPVDRRVLIDVLERLRERKAMQSALVVDDDDDARTLLADLLCSLGVRVRTCDTGAACIDALQKESSDLLFLDVTMPEQDVRRVLDFVSDDHRFENVRTVVITRNDGSGDQQEWMRRAAAEVVYEGHEHPEVLLNDLRSALTALGATVES